MFLGFEAVLTEVKVITDSTLVSHTNDGKHSTVITSE